jgi:undecaprenol kinase
MARLRALSFKYAFEGLLTALKDQPNLKFHFFVAICVIIAGVWFQIKTVEWLLIILVIGSVIAIELTNTAIEEMVNAFTDSVHPSAKKAKDVAAAAVLVTAITAAIIGLVIFLPYIF